MSVGGDPSVRRRALRAFAALLWVVSGKVPEARAAGLVTPTGSLPDLVTAIASPDGRVRTAATKAILAAGALALAELRRQGARQVAHAQPSRLDLVYTLMTGLPPGEFGDRSLGLLLEPGTSRAEVEAMGRRRGFTLPTEAPFDTSARPSCWVDLDRGRALPEVMADLLTGEPAVIGVSPNFVLR